MAKLAIWAPMVFGCVGLMLCLTYQAQRDEIILHVSHSFSRFVQHHLDAFAGFGALTSLLGVLAGLIVLRTRSKNRLAATGVGVCILTLLYSIFGLSL
jgi:hypothetical protein